ncbi:two-component sensor histidine kinase [Methylovirgula ligni]|uniref:histidine kinase n=1 Tax=Methylovirgula ligni TaxID=569860 RepID=A0A3D9Z185_9HYPH|nr:sensor histidine kinase KdpD [Methylovirgula ligni]QAY94384.1 two-component sensor histidine kinase [Methylovirgula ligni]REF87770.1 two-component system sensor histidine kinase KdpD [Methylovirgula ligni]
MDIASGDKRPSPEALLREAETGSRGRLKIFLGAAPGVGKTYEMLLTARAKHREGVDVVVGVVETHGRKETEELLAGLEVIPRRNILYKGRVLTEMDIDAILARHPRLVLVDELAHTNAPESRHPKRYLDVEELLAAGIDVYTTVNIQHIESLNDVVARITHTRVREMVPDSIVDNADDIEVIDLTPDDLIARLREGKVYIGDRAARAIDNYFSRGNLTALRELALRRTAQRVDAQMLDYMRSHAIEGPWPAGERLLVAIDSVGAAALVRRARRFAELLRAPWTALHVETSRDLRADEAQRNAIAEAQQLATRLGGVAVTLPGEDAAATILDYAQTHNVTHILVAQTGQSDWLSFLRGSTAQKLIRNAGDINIHIASMESRRKANPLGFTPPHPSRDWAAYAKSLGLVAAAGLFAFVLREALGITSVALVFLIGVLASAVRYGLFPSLVAALFGVLAYNFFFLPPFYTFTITAPENVVTLIVFAIVAVIASNLAARLRAQAIAARTRARITEELYLFSRKLASAASLDDVVWASVYEIALLLKVNVVLLLPKEGRLELAGGYPPEDQLDAADLAAAQWSFEKNHAAGRGADTLPGAKRLFIPIRTGRGAIGVIGIDSDRPGPLLRPENARLLDSLSDQAALAIERIHLAADIEKARLAEETDRLRQALLTSISHDLRTPLASIIGSATSLVAHGEELDAPARMTLLRTIQEEGERLNRFIGNLLDMTRLESGSLKPNADLVDISDLVGAALQRAQKILKDDKIETDVAAGLPMLSLDVVLMEQVLFNLLDNAAKYAPPGSTITLTARREGEKVAITIADEGEGIPPADYEQIFDKFYRVHRGDRQRVGTGLGLAICRGFVEAMNGTITAANRTDRSGAIFTLKFPVPPAPKVEALA